MTTHDQLVAAVEAARENVGWEPWDQDKHLPDHPPPWTQDEVSEWEQVHGHDFRMKCYPEYGCQVIESAANNAHLDTLAALLNLHETTSSLTHHRDGYKEPLCDVCAGGGGFNYSWPCETVAIVVDALTRMGALT